LCIENVNCSVAQLEVEYIGPMCIFLSQNYHAASEIFLIKVETNIGRMAMLRLVSEFIFWLNHFYA